MYGILVLAFAYILSQFFRSFLAVLAPVLSNELAMSEGALSIASGAWFATFALAQFPIGHWLDKYGPKLPASLMLGVAGTGGALLFASATSSLQVIVAMSLIGIGCAPVLMSAYMLLIHNFSTAAFTTMSSIFIAVGMIGNVAGAEPLAAAIELWGWRNVGYTMAGISLLTGIVVFKFVTNPVKTMNTKSGSYFDVLKIRELWLLFPLITCAYAIPAGFRGLWAGPYFDNVFNLDILAIGRIVLYFSFAQILGMIVIAPLDRIFNSRKWVVIFFNGTVLACCLWLVANPQAQLNTIVIVLAIMALFGSVGALQVSHGKSFVPEHLLGRGITLMNFFSIGGVALMQFGSGFVVEVNSNPNEPVVGYSALFAFYATVLSITMFIYLFSKDAKPRDH